MATMEDLIATISGGMHVGQEGYDLRALQEYLAQHISHPPLGMPLSPSAPYRRVQSSRSTSTTRKTSSLPPSYQIDTNTASAQPYPSPIAQTSFPPSTVSEEMIISTPVQRPGSLRRSSSYGFSAPASPGYAAFEGDAFAPLWDTQKMQAGPSDPWARVHVSEVQTVQAFQQSPQFTFQQPLVSSTEERSPWASFGQGQNAMFRAPQVQWGQFSSNAPRLPTPPQETSGDEDDMDMDQDQDEQTNEDERESRPMARASSWAPERSGTVLGLTALDAVEGGRKRKWERGRRKT